MLATGDAALLKIDIELNGTAVPRYHFNLHDHRYVPDPDGSELAGLEMAKRQAIKLAAAILVNCPEEFLTSNEWRVEVTDADGILLFTVGLAMMLAPDLWTPADRKPEQGIG